MRERDGDGDRETKLWPRAHISSKFGALRPPSCRAPRSMASDRRICKHVRAVYAEGKKGLRVFLLLAGLDEKPRKPSHPLHCMKKVCTSNSKAAFWFGPVFFPSYMCRVCVCRVGIFPLALLAFALSIHFQLEPGWAKFKPFLCFLTLFVFEES